MLTFCIASTVASRNRVRTAFVLCARMLPSGARVLVPLCMIYASKAAASGFLAAAQELLALHSPPVPQEVTRRHARMHVLASAVSASEYPRAAAAGRRGAWLFGCTLYHSSSPRDSSWLTNETPAPTVTDLLAPFPVEKLLLFIRFHLPER